MRSDGLVWAPDCHRNSLSLFLFYQQKNHQISTVPSPLCDPDFYAFILNFLKYLTPRCSAVLSLVRTWSCRHWLLIRVRDCLALSICSLCFGAGRESSDQQRGGRKQTAEGECSGGVRGQRSACLTSACSRLQCLLDVLQLSLLHLLLVTLLLPCIKL